MKCFSEVVPAGAVVPVVTLCDPDEGIDLARALSAGGIHCLEVTLRSDAALPAIAMIRQALPDITVGAGTVRSDEQLHAAIQAGAQFVVTPATTSSLREELARWDVPALPAAMTPTEMQTLLELGFRCQKLFPASTLGGIDYVKALAGPIPDIKLVPSGGVGSNNFRGYLALDNVHAVSGSFLTPGNLVNNKDWAAITALAKQASQ